MTMTQAQAVWALCREGLQQCADEAEANWLRGQPYDLDEQVPTTKVVRDLIRRSNIGLDVSEEVAEPA